MRNRQCSYGSGRFAYSAGLAFHCLKKLHPAERLQISRASVAVTSEKAAWTWQLSPCNSHTHLNSFRSNGKAQLPIDFDDVAMGAKCISGADQHRHESGDTRCLKYTRPAFTISFILSPACGMGLRILSGAQAELSS